MNPFIKPVPIKLDCDRTLLLTMNAMMEYQAIMGHSVTAALRKMQPALAWIGAALEARQAEPSTEDLSAKLQEEIPEFPVPEIRALLYCMLQHEWTQKPPANLRLTIDEVGDLIPMQRLGLIALKLFETMVAQEPPEHKEGANGQDPLMATATKIPTGLPSAPSPVTISESEIPNSVS